MKKLDMKVIAIALGLAFSAGAMAQMSKDQEPVKDGMDGMPAQTSVTPSGGTNTMGGSGDATMKDSQSAQQDRDYAAAKEKCDALASSSKSECMNEAKARFGKS